ncbi:LacI family DNA-binding transcriptional regulator [Gryllotalpicola kribbensis]|jgi:LacI family transcriptional regulator|uniref:LacI family DNA-binding transcriptional regulator n=1 Tax=Gryllotalpicola kribbensis TaxID=993084 RepID=UPI0031E0C021
MSVDAGVPPVLGRVTITDVARAAGVSVATVSKVVNSRYGVAPATYARVMAVVNELGYETSLIASSLRRSRTNVIGVLVTEFEPYSAELLKGIGAAAHGTGYELLAHSGWVGGDAPPVGWERRSLSRLAGTLIDGAILVTPTAVATDTPIPVVAIDPHTGRGGPSTVDADNVGGARAAVEHLISLGHRRIAHLRGRADLESSHRREEGYRRCLEQAGIPFDPSLVIDGDYQRSTGRVGALDLLDRVERPTAIFAANDLSALGALDAARELRIDVPGELSIVGFDDIPDATSTMPRLTTIAQPLHQMGATALKMLVEQLSGEESGTRHEHLRSELVVRETTAPPPAH